MWIMKSALNLLNLGVERIGFSDGEQIRELVDSVWIVPNHPETNFFGEML